MRNSLISFVFLECLLGWQAVGADITIRVPNGDVNGNQDTAIPFTTGVGIAPVRYQQVYDASEFSQISAGGGWVNAIGFRGDETSGGGIGVISNLQMNLATTAKLPDGLSTVFADNLGADNTLVLGPTRLGFASTVGGYGHDLTLTHPFFYNPNLGNLLLDVRNTSGIDFTGSAFYLDTQSTVGDSISSIYAFGANATTGTPLTSGLLTEFIVTPVPEPSTFALAGFGAVVLLVGRYLQTKTKNRKGKETWH